MTLKSPAPGFDPGAAADPKAQPLTDEGNKTMRKTMFAITGLFLFSVAALAQAEIIDGQVTKVDESAGKISIKHGPIKKFDMDMGMTMVFRANDPAMLKTVKAGDKVKFEADRVNGQFTVMKIEKVK
jgi:Cu/Ag efflux protein CusF